MTVLADVMFLFGYFFVMLLFMTLAVILAKSAAAWVLYAAGAIISLLSLIGNQKSADTMTSGLDMPVIWAVYVVLLVIAALLIILRRGKSDKGTKIEPINAHKNEYADRFIEDPVPKDDDSENTKKMLVRLVVGFVVLLLLIMAAVVLSSQ